MTEIRVRPRNEDVKDRLDSETDRVVALPRKRRRRYGGMLFGGSALLLLVVPYLFAMLRKGQDGKTAHGVFIEDIA